MAKTIIRKCSVNDSADNPLGKTPLGDKTPGIDPAIFFYELEDGDKIEEGAASETLVIHNSSLAVSTQTFKKSKFPYIDTFDHEGPAVVITIHNLTSRGFDHLETTSPMEVDQRVV